MWEKFLNGLASEGGNIFVLFFLILIVGSFVILKFNGATDQLYFVLGALVGILKGRNSHIKPTPDTPNVPADENKKEKTLLTE